jgi:hypothetical protein
MLVYNYEYLESVCGMGELNDLETQDRQALIDVCNL